MAGAFEYTSGPNAALAFEMSLLAPLSFVGSGSGVTQVDFTSLTLSSSFPVLEYYGDAFLTLYPHTSSGDVVISVSGAYTQDSGAAQAFSTIATIEGNHFSCTLFNPGEPDSCLFSMEPEGFTIHLGSESDPYKVLIGVDVWVPEPSLAPLVAACLIGLSLRGLRVRRIGACERRGI
jgi:hypothetical protein